MLMRQTNRRVALDPRCACAYKSQFVPLFNILPNVPLYEVGRVAKGREGLNALRFSSLPLLFSYAGGLRQKFRLVRAPIHTPCSSGKSA